MFLIISTSGSIQHNNNYKTLKEAILNEFLFPYQVMFVHFTESKTFTSLYLYLARE